MTDQPTPRAPERATEALRFVDEFLAVAGNGEGWTGEHLSAVVAWGLGRKLDDRGRMLVRAVLGSDSPAPEPTPRAPEEFRLWRIAEAHHKHVDEYGGTWGGCTECGLEWPCPTYRWATEDQASLSVDCTWDLSECEFPEHGGHRD